MLFPRELFLDLFRLSVAVVLSLAPSPRVLVIIVTTPIPRAVSPVAVFSTAFAAPLTLLFALAAALLSFLDSLFLSLSLCLSSGLTSLVLFLPALRGFFLSNFLL